MMFSLSPEKTHDSYTSSASSSRMSRNGALHHKASETMQSNTGSIANSSVHNTTPVASRKALFKFLGQGPGGNSDHRSSYYLEKPDFSFRNQTESDFSSTATSTPKQGLRSLGSPSHDNENESLFFPRSSIYSLATDPSSNSSPIHGAPPSPPSPPCFSDCYLFITVIR